MTTLFRFDHYLSLDGRRLHYVEIPGPHPPTLVFLHGIAMAWAVWQGTTRRLGSRYRMLLPDMRGHGESDHLPPLPTVEADDPGYQPPGFAEDVVRLLEHLEVSDAIVVGSSLGGLVAVVAAALAPDRVAGICAVDPPFDVVDGPELRSFRELRLAKSEGRDAIRRALAAGAPGVEPIWLEPMARMVERADPRVLRAAELGRRDYVDLSEWFPRVRCPALVMRADRAKGGVLTWEAAERAVQLLPRGELVEFPGAGHAIHATQAPKFVETLQAFVERTVHF